MQETLFGKNLEELKVISQDLGLPAFTGKQLSEWIYQKEVSGFDEMTNLSRKARALLASRYDLGLHEPIEVQESADGTKKYLFPGTPGKFIETAYIPDKDRATVCVSSQVGCKMGCLFCM
ncbi:MAG: 23S rRNA (adenine(2503)-C(2))-methyltransferase RlmN, partial [Bacteroidales bacterium]|nr:23S rRNA (adenine(2503)-C(2))-methyltransferase RlmN [Bacteroidales bacterium]